ncbi:hypothetical protein [Marinobacterium aestuariivivens]|uniref:VOC domain-containing protein n=1 Tax=Marinobacterium aestuariivivens TaxID=1698799 RepID=A0ABW2A7H4_9GAMM
MPDRPLSTGQDLLSIRIEGFEFVEFAAPDPQPLIQLLEKMGFRATAKHRSKDVTLYRQGEINFIVNATPGSFAQSFAQEHGISICALAFRVADATDAYQKLLAQGAWEASTSAGAMELNIPAVESLGGTQIYLVDRYGRDLSIYDVDFKPLPEGATTGPMLQRVSRLTLSVGSGRTAEWRDFFCRLFGFEDLTDSRIRSPDGSFELRFAEIADAEFDLSDEGISAIHLATDEPASACAALGAAGIDCKSLDQDGWKLEHDALVEAVDFLIER